MTQKKEKTRNSGSSSQVCDKSNTAAAANTTTATHITAIGVTLDAHALHLKG
jgi:hypothetical protein